MRGSSGLHGELQAKKGMVTDLRVAIYGMKSLRFTRAPDGHWLWFGEPTDDRPTVPGVRGDGSSGECQQAG